MSVHPSRRLVVATALAVALLPATPALARVVAGDLPLTAPAVAAPVAAAVTTPTSTVEGLLCGLVERLPACTHGDDAHLAAGDSGATSSTASTRIGCYGDGRSGPRVQAVYARPDAAPDRLGALLPSFRGWAGAMDKAVDDSARKTGGTRHIRFATVPSGSSCALSVMSVALPAGAFSSFSATISALQDRGLDRRDVKYLVWSDATGYCGMATTYRDTQPGAANLNNGGYPSYARVDRRCWGKAETHELAHMLGGVQAEAPHATQGMHCSDGADVLCYDDGSAGGAQRKVCDTAHSRLLDCRGDDYFSTAPTSGSWLSRHWNLASSAFLARGWTDPARPSSAPASPRSSASPAPRATSTPSPRPTTSPSPQPTAGLPLPLPLPTLRLVRP